MDRDRHSGKSLRAHSPGARPRLRVLIADDHPLAREGYRSILREAGFEVAGMAANGREAVELAERLRPDAVLMDMRMPEMDGVTATAQIKQRCPGTAILIVTAYENEEDLRKALAAGASGYIAKAAPGRALAHALRAVACGGSVIDAALLRSIATHSGKTATSDKSTNPIDALTPRELEVLRLLLDGLTNQEIALTIHYSLSTVKAIVQRIIEKLGVSDRTQAAVLAIRLGLEKPREGPPLQPLPRVPRLSGPSPAR